MKSWIFALFTSLFGASLSYGAAGSVEVQNPYVFLGGAYHVQHCHQMALNAGYRVSNFGGFVNGVYIWNACYASSPLAPAANLIRKYDVYVDRYNQPQQCAEDIEWQVPQTRCHARGTFVSCTSRRGGVKAELEQVSCVERVYAL